MRDIFLKVESFFKRERMIDMIQQKQEAVQSAISYGTGCASVWIGWVCDTTDLIQAIAILLGCVVVAVRAIHDIHRYVRWVRKK